MSQVWLNLMEEDSLELAEKACHVLLAVVDAAGERDEAHSYP